MSDIFSFPPDSPQCPIRWLLDRLGERWSLYVMCRLHDAGPQRFSEIADNLGAPISNRMLAATLDKLERDGLIERAVDRGTPLYRMTDLGASLMVPMRSLVDWTMANARAGRGPPQMRRAPARSAAASAGTGRRGGVRRRGAGMDCRRTGHARALVIARRPRGAAIQGARTGARADAPDCLGGSPPRDDAWSGAAIFRVPDRTGHRHAAERKPA